MGGTAAGAGADSRRGSGAATPPLCRTFQRSRASRCSSGESCARCRSQMKPTRGPRDRLGQPSTRQVMSRGRLWRGCLGGRRTIFCAGTSVGSLPSAASRRLRSRIPFCSATESFATCSRQNHRLRGPAPGRPHPGTGHRRPERRPSTRSFPEEIRATTARTSRSTASLSVRLRSPTNRSISARTGSLVFWAISNVAGVEAEPLGRLGRLD